MSKDRDSGKKARIARSCFRVHCLRDISVKYEGQNELITVKTPDLSTRGMFISTNRVFAEGAVLILRFRLAVTNVEVQTRCEVRHCLPGVGVGVEFIGIAPEAVEDIKRELALNREPREPSKKRLARPRGKRRQ